MLMWIISFSTLVLLLFSSIRKTFALLDSITDIILFESFRHNGTEPRNIYICIILFVSIFAPYLVCYSSGVKFFMTHEALDDAKGIIKLLLGVFLTPVGVIYFIFLDFFDAFIVYNDLFCHLFLQMTDKDLIERQSIYAQQIGLDRMAFEGFRRQKNVLQWLYEGFPQILLQSVLFFDPNGSDSNKNILLISIIFTFVNIIFETSSLYAESKAVSETFRGYVLNCVTARMAWIPFKTKIEEFGREANVKSNVNIDFNVVYPIPVLGACFPQLTGNVGFEFSNTTINQLKSEILSLEKNATLVKNTKDKNIFSTKTAVNLYNRYISFKFGSSCNMVSCHEMVSLMFAASKSGNVLLPDIGSEFDWKQSIDLASKRGKDIRIEKYGYIEDQMPILVAILLSGFDTNFGIFHTFLAQDIDVNIVDNSYQSIVFHLIKQGNINGLKILTRICNERNSLLFLNIRDIDGKTPLFLSLEMENKNNSNPNTNNSENDTHDNDKIKRMYQILLLNGADPMLSCNDETLLGYALRNGLFEIVSDLIHFGAILTSHDTPILCHTLLGIDNTTTASDLTKELERGQQRQYSEHNQNNQNNQHRKHTLQQTLRIEEKNDELHKRLSSQNSDDHSQSRESTPTQERSLDSVDFVDTAASPFTKLFNFETLCGDAVCSDVPVTIASEIQKDSGVKRDSNSNNGYRYGKGLGTPIVSIGNGHTENEKNLHSLDPPLQSNNNKNNSNSNNNNDNNDNKNNNKNNGGASVSSVIIDLLEVSGLEKVQIVDDRGNTPLHMAIEVNLSISHIKMIDQFCRKWKYVENFDGLLPIQIAISKRLYRVIIYLLKSDGSKGANQQINIALANNETINELFSWIFGEYCKFDTQYLSKQKQLLLSGGSHKNNYRQLLSIVTDFDKKQENENSNSNNNNRNINKYYIFSEAVVNELESIMVNTNTVSQTKTALKHHENAQQQQLDEKKDQDLDNQRPKMSKIDLLKQLIQELNIKPNDTFEDKITQLKRLGTQIPNKEQKLLKSKLFQTHKLPKYQIRFGPMIESTSDNEVSDHELPLSYKYSEIEAENGHDTDFDLDSDVDEKMGGNVVNFQGFQGMNSFLMDVSDIQQHVSVQYPSRSITKSHNVDSSVIGSQLNSTELIIAPPPLYTKSVMESVIEVDEAKGDSTSEDNASETSSTSHNDEISFADGFRGVSSPLISGANDGIEDAMMLSVKDRDFSLFDMFNMNGSGFSSQMVSGGDASNVINDKKQIWFEIGYSGLVEVVAFLDVVTDVLVLQELIECSLVLYASFMVLSMISPYFVAYAAFNIHASKTGIMSTVLFTQLWIIYFIIIDIVFLFHTIISFIICLATCFRYTPNNAFNNIFIKIFGLNYFEVTGYRRCRAVSQVMFESFVQIATQITILTNEKKIDLHIIRLSLCIATVHALIEGLMLYIEANAARMNIVGYGIVCLAGRFDWVPFAKYYKKLNESSSRLADKNNDLDVLDYDNLQGKIYRLSYRLPFEFSQKTAKNLIRLLNMIPTSTNLEKIDAERPHIKLGSKSCIKLDLRSIFDIYNAGDKRIVINWDNLDWDVIFANSIDKKDVFYGTSESVDLVEATSEPTFSEYSIMVQNDQDHRGWIEMIKRKRALKRLIVAFLNRMIDDGDVKVVKYIFAHMGDVALVLLDQLHDKKYSRININNNNDNNYKSNNMTNDSTIASVNDNFGDNNNDNTIAMRVIDTRNYRTILNFSKDGNMIFHCNPILIDYIATNVIELLPKTSDWTSDALISALSYVVACGTADSYNLANKMGFGVNCLKRCDIQRAPLLRTLFNILATVKVTIKIVGSSKQIQNDALEHEMDWKIGQKFGLIRYYALKNGLYQRRGNGSASIPFGNNYRTKNKNKNGNKNRPKYNPNLKKNKNKAFVNSDNKKTDVNPTTTLPLHQRQHSHSFTQIGTMLNTKNLKLRNAQKLGRGQTPKFEKSKRFTGSYNQNQDMSIHDTIRNQRHYAASFDKLDVDWEQFYDGIDISNEIVQTITSMDDEIVICDEEVTDVVNQISTDDFNEFIDIFKNGFVHIEFGNINTFDKLVTKLRLDTNFNEYLISTDRLRDSTQRYTLDKPLQVREYSFSIKFICPENKSAFNHSENAMFNRVFDVTEENIFGIKSIDIYISYNCNSKNKKIVLKNYNKNKSNKVIKFYFADISNWNKWELVNGSINGFELAQIISNKKIHKHLNTKNISQFKCFSIQNISCIVDKTAVNIENINIEMKIYYYGCPRIKPQKRLFPNYQSTTVVQNDSDETLSSKSTNLGLSQQLHPHSQSVRSQLQSMKTMSVEHKENDHKNYNYNMSREMERLISKVLRHSDSAKIVLLGLDGCHYDVFFRSLIQNHGQLQNEKYSSFSQLYKNSINELNQIASILYHHVKNMFDKNSEQYTHEIKLEIEKCLSNVYDWIIDKKIVKNKYSKFRNEIKQAWKLVASNYKMEYLGLGLKFANTNKYWEYGEYFYLNIDRIFSEDEEQIIDWVNETNIAALQTVLNKDDLVRNKSNCFEFEIINHDWAFNKETYTIIKWPSMSRSMERGDDEKYKMPDLSQLENLSRFESSEIGALVVFVSLLSFADNAQSWRKQGESELWRKIRDVAKMRNINVYLVLTNKTMFDKIVSNQLKSNYKNGSNINDTVTTTKVRDNGHDDSDRESDDEAQLQSRDKIKQIIDMFVRKSKGLISPQFVKQRIFVSNLILNDQFFDEQTESDAHGDVYSIFAEIRNQIVTSSMQTRMSSALYNHT